MAAIKKTKNKEGWWVGFPPCRRRVFIFLFFLSQLHPPQTKGAHKKNSPPFMATQGARHFAVFSPKIRRKKRGRRVYNICHRQTNIFLLQEEERGKMNHFYPSTDAAAAKYTAPRLLLLPPPPIRDTRQNGTT